MVKYFPMAVQPTTACFFHSLSATQGPEVRRTSLQLVHAPAVLTRAPLRQEQVPHP